MKRISIIALLAGLFGLTSCNKDEFKSSIPDVPFVFECNLLQGEYSGIEIPGTFIKRKYNIHHIPVGYAGLLIGQSVFSEGDLYYAFDAACPVEASRSVSLDLLNDGLGKAKCPQCGTVYNLSGGGYPESGPGKEYLRRYKVYKTGNNLVVQN